MSSHRTEFARDAEVRRCKKLEDYYRGRGWTHRAGRVNRHIWRILKQRSKA
jgi:hypothetical protein